MPVQWPLPIRQGPLAYALYIGSATLRQPPRTAHSHDSARRLGPHRCHRGPHARRRRGRNRVSNDRAAFARHSPGDAVRAMRLRRNCCEARPRAAVNDGRTAHGSSSDRAGPGTRTFRSEPPAVRQGPAPPSQTPPERRTPHTPTPVHHATAEAPLRPRCRRLRPRSSRAGRRLRPRPLAKRDRERERGRGAEPMPGRPSLVHSRIRCPGNYWPH